MPVSLVALFYKIAVRAMQIRMMPSFSCAQLSYSNVHLHVFRTVSMTRPSEVTPPILPPCSPSLLPPLAIKGLLAQLLIHRIVRLAHPLAKLASTAHPRRVLLHPGLEVFCADPAWVEFAKGGKEGLGFGL